MTRRGVSGLLQQVRHGARVWYVLAHGAGAGMSHSFMEGVADGLAERGIATMRYQFPYMEQGSKRPDPPKLAEATVRAAVAKASRLVPKLALVAGGKSFGGRMTSLAQAALPLVCYELPASRNASSRVRSFGLVGGGCDEGNSSGYSAELLTTSSASSKDIAVCGESAGYAYYPAAGPLANMGEKGKWVEDGISQGRITLSGEGDRLDLLWSDADGTLVSATNSGYTVTRMAQTEESLSVMIYYPGKTVQTYTFIKTLAGPEVLYTQNRHGDVPIPKIAAFRAPCSLLDLE